MTPSLQESCMGFAIRSTLEFQTLRSGGGTPLEVTSWSGPDPTGEELVTWRARPTNPFHGRLLRSGAQYAFWASDAGWFVIDPAIPRIAVEDPEFSLLTELRMFGVPASLCASSVGDIALHASSVEIDGQAILLAGPSMHGKTTLAAGFAARGHRLLGEDTARCSLSPTIAAYPGPSVVRLRSDVASHIDIADAMQRPMPNGRVSLLLNADQRGDGAPVPLRAIMLLRSSAEEVSLKPTRSASAARDIFALSFLLPTQEHRAANFSLAAEIVSHAEVLDLARPLTLGSMDRVVDVVERYIRS
jgi:hypothetical protein